MARNIARLVREITGWPSGSLDGTSRKIAEMYTEHKEIPTDYNGLWTIYTRNTNDTLVKKEYPLDFAAGYSLSDTSTGERSPKTLFTGSYSGSRPVNSDTLEDDLTPVYETAGVLSEHVLESRYKMHLRDGKIPGHSKWLMFAKSLLIPPGVYLFGKMAEALDYLNSGDRISQATMNILDFADEGYSVPMNFGYAGLGICLASIIAMAATSHHGKELGRKMDIKRVSLLPDEAVRYKYGIEAIDEIDRKYSDYVKLEGIRGIYDLVRDNGIKISGPSFYHIWRKIETDGRSPDDWFRGMVEKQLEHKQLPTAQKQLEDKE
jgi:hypothetical protein